ncbi:MAG UNVERIFIED_CONTAM: hypothetical protein LVQ98_01240 [Rickettsiaceae bacterium]|jgi:hypothetical protein
MNSGKFADGTDYHMISIKRFLSKLQFQSNTIKKICNGYNEALEAQFAARNLCDDSGDSEDEGNSSCWI